MAKNAYHVNKKVWQTWSKHAQGVFNRVYSAMVSNQEHFLHPYATAAKQLYWRTTCWNAAWVAADAADGYFTEVE